MRKLAGIFLFTLLLWSHCQTAVAQNVGVTGYWKTIDDNTHQPKSIVKLWEEKGKLRGRIVKVFERPERICDQCSGSLHNKPFIGLNFLWGFVRDEDNPNKWVDGEIVDPKTGEQYHCQMELTEGGKKLEVFGFIRVIFKIGRTQVWVRATKNEIPPEIKSTPQSRGAGGSNGKQAAQASHAR